MCLRVLGVLEGGGGEEELVERLDWRSLRAVIWAREEQSLTGISGRCSAGVWGGGWVEGSRCVWGGERGCGCCGVCW